MTPDSAWGGFDHDGWWIRQPGDDARSAQFASAHESHHKQLQDSTSHGALAAVYFDLAKTTGDETPRAQARLLTDQSRNVQEAFASWLPARALGWSRDEVAAAYPQYVRHYDAIDRLVAGIASPYLRFHAAHAVARACLQTTVVQQALAAGLSSFAAARLRSRDVPDNRFALLCRRPPDWSPVCERLVAAPAASGPAAVLRRLAAADRLTVELFHPENEPAWSLANQAMYDVAVQALAGAGCVTIGLNEHLDQVPALLLAAAAAAGQGPGLAAVSRTARSAPASTPLRNSEAETFVVADPLRARLLPPGTRPAALVADVARPHLFLTVRDARRLMANYRFDTPVEVPAVGAFARRTVVEPDGTRVVELLPMPAEAAGQPPAVPTVLVTAMSALARAPVAAWTRDPWLRQTVLLGDVPLDAHLDYWLSSGGRFRYTLLRIASFQRVVPVLVGAVDSAEGVTSPLLVRPLSHAGIRIHRAALAELYGPGRAVVDDTIAASGGALLELALAHLIGEEVRFGPYDRAATPA
jgi:hypothetical protein